MRLTIDRSIDALRYVTARIRIDFRYTDKFEGVGFRSFS
jgi:hypothetical protein